MKWKKANISSDRVWIELVVPRNEDHAKEMCAKVNRMLARLGATSGREFFWMDCKYCYGGDTGYVELVDRGAWLNLDYVGRVEE